MKITLPMILALLALWPLLTSGLGGGPVWGGTPPTPRDNPPESGRKPTIHCPLTPQKSGTVESLAFSPDGNTLAAGNGEGMVKYYNPATAREVVSFQVQLIDGISSLVYSPDGKTLAAGLGLGRTVLLAEATCRPRLVLDMPPHKNRSYMFGLAYSPDGGTVACGDNSGQVVLWDTKTGRSRAVLPAHIVPEYRSGPFQSVTLAQPAGITCLAFSPDGTTLVSIAPGAPVRFWDAASGAEKPCLIQEANSISAAFSPDGKTLAVGSWNGVPYQQRYAITLWEVATGRKRAEMPDRGKVSHLAYLPGSRNLVSLEAGPFVRLWDAESGRLLHSMDFDSRYSFRCLAIAPDGKQIAVGGGDTSMIYGSIQLIQTDGAKLVPW